MKVSFQILHNYQDNPLKIIGNALHLTMQDDLLMQIDLRSAMDFISLTLNKPLQTGVNFTSFEIDVDTDQYDFSKYDDFLEGLKNRLKATDGFHKLLKYVDEIRADQYVKYYLELAEMEMKMREVFSYIFYNKYSVTGNDLFEEFDAKTAGVEEPKPDELDKRLENKFFYLTFSGYLKFEKPKDVLIKELIPLIQTKEQYEELRAHLNSRGITVEHHVDFLQAVRATLDPIESVRNCIAHNRQIPNRTDANYTRARTELLRFIQEFWAREIQEVSLLNDVNDAEIFAYDNLDDLLSAGEFNEYNNEVVIHDHWQAGNPEYRFNSLEDLRQYLLVKAREISDAAFDAAGNREQLEAMYNNENVVDKVLNRFAKGLIILNWI
ncbi:hypothetical protein [Deminuibacter soli]|uniref:Uncharacterized protein n=1 Tax=Deminuibacter soli TaxID=2291815 RepID=A0A3E1NP72_9BACT|nr:hypothetical protein [Deminuibacter soli]RFM29588.1 hypothetical protein DXN05_00970 [Deminuibacter soli]